MKRRRRVGRNCKRNVTNATSRTAKERWDKRRRCVKGSESRAMVEVKRLGLTNLPLGGKRGPMCGNESGVLSRPGLARLNRNMRHITRHFYQNTARRNPRFRAPITVSQFGDRFLFPYVMSNGGKTDGEQTSDTNYVSFNWYTPCWYIGLSSLLTVGSFTVFVTKSLLQYVQLYTLLYQWINVFNFYSIILL